MRWRHCHEIRSAMVMASSASLLPALALFLLLLNVAQCIDSSEVPALLGFKNSLIDVYGHTNDWSASDSTPCSWTGVQCNELGRVAALKLGNMNLSGSISGPDLAGLSSLVNISLEQNNLTGSLPGQLASLVHLRWLNISHNNLGPEFPANISLLPKLEVLDTYNNNFRGPLPPQLGDLKSIRHLHLGGSYFSGSIPPELGRLSTLEYLALSGNSLGGRIPPELGNLSSLKELYLGYYNSFEGGIPRELGRLSSLAKLDLAYCGLTGPIPRDIGNLTLLDTIFLQINNLSGSIPREIGSLVRLRSLDLSNNLLSGPLPDEMAMLESLELLNLFRNKLEGSIPTFIGDLPNLQVLNLWANHFTGVIPPLLGIGSMALTGVDLSSNSLTGTIPEGLCSGGKLQILILYGNQLNGGIPAALGDCSTLVRVRLGYNRLSGSLPPRILGLPDVQMLELVGNQLDGGIPAVPIAAKSLEFLDLSSNQLRGDIPAAIGNLSNLKNLLLSDNHLVGPLPTSIGELKQLSIMDASGNSLSGQIPASVGACSRLSSLDLSRNQLEGEIPGSMGGLQALDALNVSHNELSGRIPQELARIASLTSGDFSYNRLFGPIPSTGQFGFFNASSFQGNSGLCGTPVNRACADSGGGAKQSGGKGATRRHSGGDGGIYGWAIGAMFLAALLVAVIGTTVFIRRHSDKVAEWAVRLRKLGGDAAARRRPWRLTAFQKLDFAAADVVECLSEENVIGRGMSGTVYRGMMPSGEIVAVKRLTSSNVARAKSNGGSSHDDFGFSAEIQTLGKIRHMNIVKLLGFCSNQETNLLVYEYMPNGSLGEMIHGSGKKGSAPLDWETRYKIAVQAANGLCYLHHDCSPLIVHRDVKSNNILLDSNMRAHVADFGLAKLVHGGGKSESMSSIAGSYGYIAPEYAYTLKVNEKSDIYSFGVVLLELVTGRRPIDPEFGDGVDIVQWARKKIQTKDGVLDILDSKLGGPDMLPLHEAMLVLRVALLCSSDSPSDRPTMRDVVQMLTDVKPKLRDSGKEFGSNRAVLPPSVAASDPLIDV